MMVHEIKSTPDNFQALWDGVKRAEIRLDDRGYRTGDVLVVNEWRPPMSTMASGVKEGSFTGRYVRAEITHRTEFMQRDGYVVLSVESLGRFDGSPAINSAKTSFKIDGGKES